MIFKFNEYIKENNSGYSEITDEEYIRLKFTKSVDIEDKHLSNILKLFNELIDSKVVRYYVIPRVAVDKYECGKLLKMTYDDGDLYLNFDIVQIEDEWFLVSIFNQDVPDQNARIKIMGVEEFFKCDQFYGLELLLKFILFI